MRCAGRAALLAAVAVAAVVLVVVTVADVVATRAAESRLAASVSQALGLDAEVELGPWPATPRLLAGDLVVDIVADGGGEPKGVLRSLDARLTGVRLDGDWRSFTAGDGAMTASLRSRAVPIGVTRVTATATDLSASFGHGTSHLSAARVDADGGTATATASRLLVDLQHPGDRLGRTSVSADVARVEIGEGPAVEGLPLDLEHLLVRLDDLRMQVGPAQPTRVHADLAEVEAAGLPLEGTGARLRQLDAQIPDLVVEHVDGAEELVIQGDGAGFTAELGEAQLGELWAGPGAMELTEGAVRLVVGPIAIEVDVQADGRHLRLSPRLPTSLRLLVGELPSITVTPQLPEGVTLSQVRITPGALRLTGQGDRIVLPLS